MPGLLATVPRINSIAWKVEAEPTVTVSLSASKMPMFPAPPVDNATVTSAALSRTVSAFANVPDN